MRRHQGWAGSDADPEAAVGLLPYGVSAGQTPLPGLCQGFTIRFLAAPSFQSIRNSARRVTACGRTDERERLMRRTVLSVMALACTAVLAGAVPAFADGATPTQSPTAVKRTAPSTGRSTPSQTAAPAPAKSARTGQVADVPQGAPNTGVAPVSSHSGSDGGLIGGGAAVALAIGAGGVLVVRRRRATGA
jgi:cobalamin biosynthesis Mg chelatase CobN